MVCDVKHPVNPFMSVKGSSRELEIGKAAEHLVCADLILSGYRAFLSDQGLPYDIVIDLGDRLIRVQVKGCQQPRNVNASGRNERLAYNFSVRRRGKNGSKRLDNGLCDIVAMVALDIRIVAYMPIELAGQTVQLSPPGDPPPTRTWRGGWSRAVDQWPLKDALSGPSAYKKTLRRENPTHCKHGHEYAVTGFVNGKSCAECNRISSRERQRRIRKEMLGA